MINFLFKGLLRDRSRSLFPVLVITAGVALTVILYCWIDGITNDMIKANANFYTGHVKIMTRAYAKEEEQMPNDLAFIGVDSLLQELKTRFPDLIWMPRIRFGGLLDKPDENGETLAQGPVFGMAVDLISGHSPEYKILNLQKALIRGKRPERSGEILISNDFASELGIEVGDTVTLISSSMFGGMIMYNFTVSGTIRFGITAMDRGAMIADIRDIQTALEMNDMAGEILGYFRDGFFHEKEATAIVQSFNRSIHSPNDFDPIMFSLRDQKGLSEILDMVHSMTGLFIGIFVFVMSLVLWNSGLMNSLRRYGEIGVRLAMGETKTHIYWSLLIESLMIAIIGTIIGTVLGVAVSTFLQVHGVNIGSMMKNSSVLLSDVVRARVTYTAYFIGFIPGILATILGTSISGIGIYRRQTSQLFKELEV